MEFAPNRAGLPTATSHPASETTTALSTPGKAFHCTTTTTTTTTSTTLVKRDWDMRLAKALIEEHGMVVVEDSRVLALQIQQGLRRTHGVGAGRPSSGVDDRSTSALEFTSECGA